MTIKPRKSLSSRKFIITIKLARLRSFHVYDFVFRLIRNVYFYSGTPYHQRGLSISSSTGDQRSTAVDSSDDDEEDEENLYIHEGMYEK